MSLAELKRKVQPGIRIKLIDSSMRSHRFLNVERKVGKVDSMGFYMTRDTENSPGSLSVHRLSRMEWPRANEVVFSLDGKAFTILDDDAFFTYLLEP